MDVWLILFGLIGRMIIANYSSDYYMGWGGRMINLKKTFLERMIYINLLFFLGNGAYENIN